MKPNVILYPRILFRFVVLACCYFMNESRYKNNIELNMYSNIQTYIHSLFICSTYIIRVSTSVVYSLQLVSVPFASGENDEEVLLVGLST